MQDRVERFSSFRKDTSRIVFWSCPPSPGGNICKETRESEKARTEEIELTYLYIVSTRLPKRSERIPRYNESICAGIL